MRVRRTSRATIIWIFTFTGSTLSASAACKRSPSKSIQKIWIIEIEGATRNFIALKLAEKQAQKEKRKKRKKPSIR